ncbi:WD repeat-containing protein 6 [Dissophora globulifera]|uniref:WD repeat-containing protein 6 n=1 Tax=Dissophora globulifera TaxID=979702 RepID=A0A9P6UQ23_9FUNG|nr:WD repeat-containing protein 6 [Dissophora globulifera]
MTAHPLQRMVPVHSTTPVTALAYHDADILLSGQGPYLKAIRVSTADTLACIHLGGDWKVHRIVLANVQRIGATSEARLFLAFGAKSLRIMRLTVLRSGSGEGPKLYFQHLWNVPHMKDWILDAQWLWPKADLQGEFPTTRSSLNPAPTKPPTSIAIGYAHNFVEVFDLPQDPFSIPHQQNDLSQDDDLHDFRLSFSVQSEEHCTLFCGRFHNNTLEDLWFASGTVFCHALLWKVHHGTGVEAPVAMSLIGHEGILFGIRWSDNGKAVCTVSDDRTIRVWDITNPGKILHTTHFGHTARVWDCQIIGTYLVSISEDASCRVWRNPLLTDLSDKDDMSDCLACWEGHEGKSAWSVAVSDNAVVATGGGDGGIHLWRLDSIVSGSTDAEQNTKDIDLPDTPTYYPNITPQEKEFIRDFVITSNTQSVYGTNTGYILIRDDESETWSTLYNSPLLKNYVTMESSRCGRIVVAGCLTGKLVVLSVRNEFVPLIADTLDGIKIQFIFLLDGAGEDDFTIAVFRANCTVGVFRLCISTASSTATCTYLCDLKLPNSNKAIHAAFYSPRYNLLLLGSRSGTVLVYNLNHLSTVDRGTDTERAVLDSIVQLERCHGLDSVSSILMVTELGEGFEGKDRIIVYTTGRDGSWTKYRFLGLPDGEVIGAGTTTEEEDDDEENDKDDFEDDSDVIGASAGGDTQGRMRSPSPNDQENGTEIVLQKIYSSKITKGWLEQVFLMDGELLLLGFFNKKLFVYNESKHFELRSFARELTAGSELFQNAKLQNNFHGREVRHLRFLGEAQPLTEGAPAPIITASGGEDCRLRLFQYIPYKTQNSCTALRPLCNLKPRFGAAIRCLEWSYTDTAHSYLLFTGGAIESMRAWQVTLSIANSYQVQVVQDHLGRAIPEHTPLSLGCLELAQCPHASETLETRIMDLSVFRLAGHPGKHFVASVYSDGASRVWLFDETSKNFVLAINSNYHNKCILQVAHVKFSEGGILMFTAATDGNITVWDLTHALDAFLARYTADAGARPVHAQRPFIGKSKKMASKYYVQNLTKPIAEISAVHMSGVNSMCVRDLGSEGILVVSGGDDNALAVSLVKTVWSPESRTIHALSADMIARDNNAHGSAIQAVSIISPSEVVTTSQDQMISLWRVGISAETSAAALVKQESQFVHVPDPSTMDILPASEDETRHSVAIAGIGVQIFQVGP